MPLNNSGVIYFLEIMLKNTLIILLVALSAQANAEVKPDNNNSSTTKPEELKNLSPLLTVKTGNPVYLTNQAQNSNFYLYPILESNPTVQTIDIHKYDPNTNILKTIIIIPPKIKKTCGHNSTVLQPDVQTEKPTKKPCNNIKTTTTKTTTISRTTNKPCNLTTTATSPTPANERTRIPVIGDSDGSTKCIQDGVYRANNVTCDQYYVCIYGIQYLMDCPYGLVFNEQLKVCDWLENVTNCKPPAFKNFACPDEGYGADSNLILKFRYRDSCSQYVACHKRKARLLRCDSGYYFHEKSSTCMSYRSSSNCRDVWYSY